MEVIVGVANLRAKHGNNYYALKLILTSINYPGTILETKVGQEIKSARTFAEDNTVESV